MPEIIYEKGTPDDSDYTLVKRAKFDKEVIVITQWSGKEYQAVVLTTDDLKSILFRVSMPTISTEELIKEGNEILNKAKQLLKDTESINA